ncbi:ArnT family glycosyltransferase [Nostoc sp.]|uniref:ArnT family glycosyltransferase n=1 Tax=Nostoc sp. TaxID=1180 RepID=UPI002FF7AAB1
MSKKIEIFHSLKVDRFLLAVVILTFCSCLYGINWGIVESWHPDQMAFKNLFVAGKMPLNPGEFLKPPFYTYYIFFLDRFPLGLLGTILHIPQNTLDFIILIWAQVLTVFLFLGSIVLVFQITKNFFGLFSARIITVVFATSATFIVHIHYLTTDIPVTFGMLLAFYFSQNILLHGGLRNYILAGFFTGIATATKYNGLPIGLAIILAHIFSLNYLLWKKLLFSKKLILGLSMVVIGFIVGNPFAILDYPTFLSDFLYNYTITPVYDGQHTGNSYWEFFVTIPTIIGWPSVVIFFIAILISIYLVFSRNQNWMEKKAMLLLMGVFLIYYYKFGSFPRIVPRFVLPIVPYLLIMSAPFWEKLRNKRVAVSILLIALISYNVLCSVNVGKSFVEEPRMIARKWIKENIPKGSSIEQTTYTPDMSELPEMKFTVVRMPFIGGRYRVFKQQFKENKWLLEKLKFAEKEPNEQWYSLKELISRKPDYILINSMTFGRFIRGRAGLYYPTSKQFFNNLISEKYPYKIIFDQELKKTPIWMYPQDIEFLNNRMIILARKDT